MTNNNKSHLNRNLIKTVKSKFRGTVTKLAKIAKSARHCRQKLETFTQTLRTQKTTIHIQFKQFDSGTLHSVLSV